MKKSIIFILTFFTNFALARDPLVDLGSTMCQKDEDIYISCSFDLGTNSEGYSGPAASVCAKNNTTPDRGYVQYRYGTPRKRDDSKKNLIFPQKKLPPRGIFKIETITHGNDEFGISALTFNIGTYQYSFENHTPSSYRLVARQGANIVFDKRCTLPGKNYLVDKAYEGIEYTPRPQGPAQ